MLNRLDVKEGILAVISAHCLACSRLSVSEDDQKASGRQAGSAASGIREKKGEASLFSLPDPAYRPRLHCQRAWNRLPTVKLQVIFFCT